MRQTWKWKCCLSCKCTFKYMALQFQQVKQTVNFHLENLSFCWAVHSSFTRFYKKVFFKSKKADPIRLLLKSSLIRVYSICKHLSLDLYQIKGFAIWFGGSLFFHDMLERIIWISMANCVDPDQSGLYYLIWLLISNSYFKAWLKYNFSPFISRTSFLPLNIWL